MWEKEAEKEEKQIYPQNAIPAKPKISEQGTDHVLFVQILVCLVIVAFVLLAKTMGVSFFSEMQDQYSNLLENGTDFTTQNELVRFVSTAVEGLRMQASELMEQLNTPVQNGQGGFFPVRTKEVPEGASMRDYQLSSKPTMPVQGVLTSAFGFRDNPVNGADDFHMGNDIAAETGTPVYAALDGQIKTVGNNDWRGNYIVVRHENDTQTLYQHLNYIFVREGESIAAGGLLGSVGETGMVTGPHLHFELILGGERVDPTKAFAEPAS